MDFMDWRESFESEADEESYQRWLDELEVEEHYAANQVEKIMHQVESF